MRFRFFSIFVALSSLVCAATLEKLSVPTLIEKSTSIVRGRAGAPGISSRNGLLYTDYTIAVSEVWKGSAATRIVVSAPGGTNGKVEQRASGAPQLQPGQEYVLFLWTGRSGLTQILGLSQGLFNLGTDNAGQTVASRRASSETVVDPLTRKPIADEDVQMRLDDLRLKVRRQLTGTAVQ